MRILMTAIAAAALTTAAGGAAFAQAGGQDQIDLYGDQNYQGPSTRLTGNHPSLAFPWNVNSLRVSGQTWRLCSGLNYTGTCVDVSQSAPSFSATGLSSLRSAERVTAPAVGANGYGQGDQGRAGGQGYQAGGYGQGDQGRGYGQGDRAGGYGQGDQGRGFGQGGGYPFAGDWRGRFGDLAQFGFDRRDLQEGVVRMRYNCEGGLHIDAVLDFRAGRATLQADRERLVTLNQVQARRGFRFEGYYRTFSGLRGQATYSEGRRGTYQCRSDRFQDRGYGER